MSKYIYDKVSYELKQAETHNINLMKKPDDIPEIKMNNNIFIYFKMLGQQLIVWDTDLNDGVRLNIRPFVEAGVLRNKFNVKWGVDRGKNPLGSYWGEVRDNDKHLSLEAKQAAREKNKK